MKKSYLILAAAALTLGLASCSNDESLAEAPKAVETSVDDGAIGFDAYVNRSTTRAGATGELTTSTASSPQISLQAEGFGVFGYYGDGVVYGPTLKPDFFYNQKVSGADWTYSPIKYWPNEFGQSAESDGQDRLTFFAYAPWVNVTPATGRIASGSTTSGIIGLTSNTTTGDPYVKYSVDFDPENRVDLCYGVSANGLSSSVDDANSPNAIAAGKPYIDVFKPKTGDKIKFDFKHALAALNVVIDADIDEESHGTTGYLDGNTKIYVREVTFEGFTDNGMLNLSSSTTPLWYEMSTANTLISAGKVTIYDGRSNGKEGQTNGDATNETPKDLNETIIQKATTTNGVPAASQVNLFNSTTANAPIYVIPTGQQLKVTITYDVETADEKLAGFLSDGTTHGSSIENKITKNITFNSGSALTLEAGKLYTVSLHLGMTSVKFDAEVSPWPTATTADNTDLPINKAGTYAVGGTHTITAPAAGVTNAKLQISGLTNSATLTTTPDGTVVTAATCTTPVGAATQDVTYSVAANTTFYKKSGSITLAETGAATSTTIITVSQSAQALGLSVASLDAAGTKITLNSTGAFANTADWSDVTKTKLTVIKKAADGTTSTITPTSFTGTSTTAADLTLSTAVQAGEEYFITVQTGDAAAETVTAKIGGIAFASATIDKLTTDPDFTIEPIIYGNGVVAAGGWNSGTLGTATINVNTGEVHIVATGSSVIRATLTLPGSSDGYFYSTATQTASYTLNVN